MRSREEITQIFRDSAGRNNLEGDHIEVLVNLLSEALYQSEFNNLRFTKEASATQSTSINSKIVLAMDRNYSVFRGFNGVIDCSLTSISGPQTWTTGQEVFSSSQFNLYSTDNYNFELDQSINVRLYVSNGSMTSTITPTAGSSFIEILENDLSDLLYVRNNPESSSRITYPTTNIFGDSHINFTPSDPVLEVPSDSDLFILTIQNFGFRVYNITNYTGAEVFEVQRFNYMDGRITENLFDTINFSVFELDRDSIAFSGYIPRATIPNIEDGINSQIRTSSTIRSRTDVIDALRTSSLFSNFSDVSFTFDSSDNSITYYYVERVGIDPDTEYDDIFEEWQREFPASYLISGGFRLEEAVLERHSIRVQIYTNSPANSVDREAVLGVFRQLERRIGITISISRIISQLNAFSFIDYVEVSRTDSGNQVSTPIELGDINYALFDVNILPFRTPE